MLIIHCLPEALNVIRKIHFPLIAHPGEYPEIASNPYFS